MFSFFASHPFNLYVTLWLIAIAWMWGYCIGRRDAARKIEE